VLLHPSYVSVDPALQKLSACGANAAIGVEQAFFCLDKCLGLAKGRDVEISQGVAKMLLGDRGADSTDRYADDAGRLAGKRTLPIGT
jgi:hypothetical protein